MRLKEAMSIRETQDKQKTAPKGKLIMCSRDHKFYKSTSQPVCPTCWPGRYKKVYPVK